MFTLNNVILYHKTFFLGDINNDAKKNGSLFDNKSYLKDIFFHQ